MGQCLPAKSLRNHFRRDIHHPVAQAGLCSGPAIMNFIRVDDDHLTGAGRPLRTAIFEPLHAVQCQANGIGIMTMRREAVALKVGFDPLNPGFCRRDANAVPTDFAQTFKTVSGRTA